MKVNDNSLKEKIYKVSEEFISKFGMKGWSMNDLAEKSGITKMTLYKIIDSKEQLIHDIIYNKVHEFQDSILEASRSNENFMKSFEATINILPELLNSFYINKAGEIFQEFPGIEAVIIKETDKLIAEIKTFFQSGIDRGFLKSDITPEFIHEMFLSFVLYFIKYSNSYSEASRKIKHAMYSVVYGISI